MDFADLLKADVHSDVPLFEQIRVALIEAVRAGSLPAGTRLAMGSAIIEVTDQPHTGCKKFAARFGNDAQKFVMTPVGRQMRLRGLCAKVVQPGTIRRGDSVRKI